MKEEEAKTKVCPFMSLNGIDRNGIAYVVKSKCICGDCMAWKWDENGVHTTNENGTIFHEGYCARIGQ